MSGFLYFGYQESNIKSILPNFILLCPCGNLFCEILTLKTITELRHKVSFTLANSNVDKCQKWLHGTVQMAQATLASLRLSTKRYVNKAACVRWSDDEDDIVLCPFSVTVTKFCR